MSDESEDSSVDELLTAEQRETSFQGRLQEFVRRCNDMRAFEDNFHRYGHGDAYVGRKGFAECDTCGTTFRWELGSLTHTCLCGTVNLRHRLPRGTANRRKES